jgi:uncharacterized protein YlzI (FlbEa/FlbD family)
MIELAVVLEMFIVHTLDGREVYLNPRHIVSVITARAPDDPGRAMHPDVHCAISLSDGKVYTTKENCTSVEHRLKGNE